MASRKAKPREKKTSRTDDARRARASTPDAVEIEARSSADRKTAIEEGQDSRPSSTMTREVDITAISALMGDAQHEATVPLALPTTRVLDDRLPPAPPSTSTSFDDLAQTIEAPAALPRMLLLEAGEALIDEMGFAALSDAAIARRAGVTLDVFHAHFANKTALLHALNERFCVQAMNVADEAARNGTWRRPEPRAVIEEAIRSVLDVVFARAGLVRAVLACGDERMLDGLRRIGMHFTSRIVSALEETNAGPDERPRQEDVAFALMLVFSLAHHAIVIGTYWTGFEFQANDFYERATRVATAYLETRRAAPAGQA
jgi:AcrR family transcriptional regulator